MNNLSLINLSKLMQYRPTLKDTASWFNVSEDTIERRIKEWENSTFSEFKEKYSSEIKQKLVNKAIEMATNGNATMLIFCLKNYCSWVDKPIDLAKNETNNIKIFLDKDDLNL